MGKALVHYDFNKAISKLGLKTQTVNFPLSMRKSGFMKKQAIPDYAREKAMAKQRVVHKWLDAKSEIKEGLVSDHIVSFVTAINTGLILQEEFKLLGTIKVKTLYRWICELKKYDDNWECLVDPRSLKEDRTTLTIAEQAAFLRCYCNPAKLSIEMSAKVSRWLLNEVQIESNAGIKAYKNFITKYRKRNNHIVVYARDGKKACLDKCLPYITRDVNTLKVGDVLVADGHKLNFFIRHPKTGKPVRMILIVFFDWRSRYPMGWQIMPTENVVGIQAAFFNACVCLGKYPVIVYIDNGKAFKAKVFTETNPNLEHLSGLYVRLNVQFICARAYFGRSKVVERMFRTFNDQCIRVLPSYCGASIADKPAWMHRDEKFHKKIHAIATGNYVPNMSEAAVYIQKYFDFYVNQPHDGLDEQTPFQVATTGFGPGIDPQKLAYEFLWRKEVKPSRCQFPFMKIDYECKELLGYTGKALALYDNANLTKLFVYSNDKVPEFIGVATPKNAIHPMARILGDETDVITLKETLKDHAKAKKITEEAVAELSGYKGTQEVQDALKVIPWNEKTEVKKQQSVVKDSKVKFLPEKEQPLEISDDQLESDISELETNRPFFLTTQDRYDWLLSFQSDGGKLTKDEFLFIADFENQLNAELEGFVDDYKEAVGF